MLAGFYVRYENAETATFHSVAHPDQYRDVMGQYAMSHCVVYNRYTVRI